MLALLFSIVVVILFLILVCKFSTSIDQSLPEPQKDPVKENQKSYERMIRNNPLNINDALNLHPGNSQLGPYGEFLTLKKIVDACGKSGSYFKIVNNIYIKGKYEPTEIDSVLIHKTGIYVFESKNFSGSIYGRFEDQNWTQVIKYNAKKSFYSPVWQNRGHISALKRVLGFNLPYYSIIVFSERCELKQITGSSNDTFVVKRENLEPLLTSIFNKSPVLTQSQIDSLYKKVNQAVSMLNSGSKPQNIDISDVPF